MKILKQLDMKSLEKQFFSNIDLYVSDMALLKRFGGEMSTNQIIEIP